MSRALSIVIPVGPGDASWAGLLPQLHGQAAEVVLAFAAGHRPPGAPQDASHRWIEATAGRACQLNAGAAACTMPHLWFLHSDSRLDARALTALDRFLARDAEAIGYFDLDFERDGPALTRLNATGARWRSRLLGLPFGDQGFVMPARVYRRLRGFPDVASEDHALVWRARAHGVPLQRVGAVLRTSARRYAERGWLRTTARHVGLTAVQAWRFSRAERTP
jgi:hypothetical protein